MAKPIPIIEIEKKYAVEKIKVNGIYFWPFLRVYIGSQLHFNKNRRVKVDKKYAFELVKTLFYGFNNWFTKADKIFISSFDQRRLIKEKYTDRMDYFIQKIDSEKVLLIEQSNPKHHPISQVKTKKIVSKTWFYLIEKIIGLFILLKFENEEVIKSILKEYNLDTNYKNLAKSFVAQYKFSRFFFKLKKVKTLYLTTAYNNCARVKAAKKLDIKVIEFQHGIINESHFGYNVSKEIDSDFYPDYLLTFGEKEKEVFSTENHYINDEKVLALGSFYIDFLVTNNINKNATIQILKKKYQKLIAMSCQDAMDNLWIPFFKELSQKDTKNAYILMPRHKKVAYYDQFNFSENVHFITDLNTYEIILQSDIHTTINSTTAIESISLGTPNILMNINNLAKNYLEKTLKKHTYFANTPDEFLVLLNKLEPSERNIVADTNKQNIMNGFEKNIDKILKQIEE